MTERTSDHAFWLGIAFVVVLTIAMLTLLKGAKAQATEIGTGLICDTSHQVERYIALLEVGTEQALAAVNEEAQSKHACAVVTIAYTISGGITTVRYQEQAYQVVEIVVVGTLVHGQWKKTEPFTQYTLFLVLEDSA